MHGRQLLCIRTSNTEVFDQTLVTQRWLFSWYHKQDRTFKSCHILREIRLSRVRSHQSIACKFEIIARGLQLKVRLLSDHGTCQNPGIHHRPQLFSFSPHKYNHLNQTKNGLQLVFSPELNKCKKNPTPSHQYRHLLLISILLALWVWFSNQSQK